MVAIVFFETTEVAFKGIGGFGYARIGEVAKEIRQCFEQHAPGTHKILEDPSTVSRLIDRWAKALVPGMDVRAEKTRLLGCLDR